MSLRQWLIKKLGGVDKEDYNKIVSDLKSSKDECRRLREQINNPKLEIKQTYMPIETLSGYVMIDKAMLGTMQHDDIFRYVRESAVLEIARTIMDKRLIEFSYDPFVVNPYAKAIKLTIRLARPSNFQSLENIVSTIKNESCL